MLTLLSALLCGLHLLLAVWLDTTPAGLIANYSDLLGQLSLGITLLYAVKLIVTASRQSNRALDLLSWQPATMSTTTMAAAISTTADATTTAAVMAASTATAAPTAIPTSNTVSAGPVASIQNEPSVQNQPLPTNPPPSNPGRPTAPRLASSQRLGKLATGMATRESGAPEDAILADWLSPDRLAPDPLSPSRPLFLVYLSAQCPLCQKLSADLVGLIAGFGDRVTIGLVLQGNAEEFSELVQRIARLADDQHGQQPQQNPPPSNYPRYRLAYDEAGVLREVLAAEGVPFALMVSPSDHVAETITAAAPIAYGPDRIRLSFALLLNALA